MGFLDKTATLNISDEGAAEKRYRPFLKKHQVLALIVVIGILLVFFILYIIGAFERPPDKPKPLENPSQPLAPSVSRLHLFKKGAVCADGAPCAEIGKNILDRNGSAVDAAIATLFCNGLVNMQSMGIGGGFLMTIYNRKEKKSYTLNAREVAPIHAKEGMFDTQKSSRKGPLAIGVPGELKGYWAAHQRFGKLPWKELVKPSIELCETGYRLTSSQGQAIRKLDLEVTEGLYKDWFVEQERVKNNGDFISPQKLCDTLRRIAKNGGEDFYNGTLADDILYDLRRAGSIIVKEDFLKYRVNWTEPIKVNFSGNYTLHSIPPPGSGVLLGFILNILDGYKFDRNSIDGDQNTILTYHRIIEAFKYAYAKRTELGDPNFIKLESLLKNLTSDEFAEDIRLRINDYGTSQEPEHYGAIFYNHFGDNGTAHISILAANGDAVSVTSTINLYFGAEVVSESTGITFNSVMDDFSISKFTNYFGLPGSPSNAIQPGKRPLSSMSPSIITDTNGDVVMVIGASGGTQITTGIAQVIMRTLWFDQNIKEAVDAPRLHHQVYPMSVQYEFGTLKPYIEGLEALGHNTTRLTSFSVICALLKKGEYIFANADYRKGGDVYGID